MYVCMYDVCMYVWVYVCMYVLEKSLNYAPLLTFILWSICLAIDNVIYA